jgi:hypothetical protein
MKETRFIELLNLYVDQQLTGAEAAELEAELQGRPERRRTYQQYCRMQKACTQLFEHERRNAPASLTLARAVAAADEKIVSFPAAAVRRSRLRYASGLAAMAACVAFVLILQRSPTAPGEPMTDRPAVAAVPVDTPMLTADEPVAIPAADPQSRAMRPMYYSVFINPRDERPGASERQPLATPEEQASFAWMNQVNLRPLRRINPDELVFQPKTNLQPPSTDVREDRGGLQQYYEQAAFQYQK